MQFLEIVTPSGNRQVLDFATLTSIQTQKALSIAKSEMMRMVLGILSSTMDERIVGTEWILSNQVAAGSPHSSVSSVVADFVIDSGYIVALFSAQLDE